MIFLSSHHLTTTRFDRQRFQSHPPHHWYSKLNGEQPWTAKGLGLGEDEQTFRDYQCTTGTFVDAISIE